MEDKTVLCISIADSGGGIGIGTDIKTLEAHHIHSFYVHTAIVAQNSATTYDSIEIPTDLIQAQLEALLEKCTFHAVKIGILPSVRIVQTVAKALSKLSVPIVLDCSFTSRNQFSWVAQDVLLALIEHIIPKTTLITPNKQEAEQFSGVPIDTEEDAQVAVQRMAQFNYDMGVLLKGRLCPYTYRSDEYGDKWCADILYHKADFHLFEAPTIGNPHNIGSGDTLSTAIAANLALGFPLAEAIRLAKQFVSYAIKYGTNGFVRHQFEHLLPKSE